MKTSKIFMHIVLMAVVSMFAVSMSYANEANSNGFSVTSSGIVAPIVTNEAAWEQWPNYEGQVGFSGNSMEAQQHEVRVTRANGPVNMKRGNFVGWPNDTLAFNEQTEEQMVSSDSVRSSFGTIGTSVMKESTWEQWLEVDESMTE